MASDGKFSTDTVLTLGKRAALLCSNPDCGALTSGPTVIDRGSLNIGEAAHIFGRTSTAARYNSEMTVAELSDITNGIWLCRNCHKLIDNDPVRYSADLLFGWRRLHEKTVLERVGKPGDQIRERLQAEHLRLFKDTSALAQQIVLDRPDLWEFKLTAEILRNELGAIYERWQYLKQGMYARKSVSIPMPQLAEWLSTKFDDIARFIGSLPPLLKELNKAWGDLGVPGDDKKILAVCKLLIASAENLLAWEEDVRFCRVPEEFKEAVSIIHGVAGRQFDELLRIPAELAKILALDNPTGTHHATLVFTVPENFAENFNNALNRATRAYAHRR